jgi:hypothetical protein
MASANALALTKKLADAYFTGTFKILLVSSLPSEADLDTFAFRSSIANEVGASGTYAVGGAAVTCAVGAVDTTNNRTPVTFGNPTPFTGANISAVGGWIYKVIGSAATDELIGFVDFTGTITSTNGTFTVTISNPLYINR